MEEPLQCNHLYHTSPKKPGDLRKESLCHGPVNLYYLLDFSHGAVPLCEAAVVGYRIIGLDVVPATFAVLASERG